MEVFKGFGLKIERFINECNSDITTREHTKGANQWGGLVGATKTRRKNKMVNKKDWLFKKNRDGVSINLNKIISNPENPRKPEEYTKVSLDQLKESLQSDGLNNAITIDEMGMLLAGHRRVKAAKELDWKKIKCNIKIGLTRFGKCAFLVRDNATQEKYDEWEYRECIGGMYWDIFLADYTPKHSKDNGHVTFAKQMGLSISTVRNIVKATSKSNKNYSKKMKLAKLPVSTADEIMKAPKEVRDILVDKAIKLKKEYKNKGKDCVREKIRIERRLIKIEEVDELTTLDFKRWENKIELLGMELCNDILKKGDINDLLNLENAFKKYIIPFYTKLQKHIKNPPQKSAFDVK